MVSKIFYFYYEADTLNIKPHTSMAPSVDAYGNNAQDLDVFMRNFS